jgi:hypothetical protein
MTVPVSLRWGTGMVLLAAGPTKSITGGKCSRMVRDRGSIEAHRPRRTKTRRWGGSAPARRSQLGRVAGGEIMGSDV